LKSVAVLGGGPSGAFAAERLASAGMRTVLLDEKLAWEKPCGGGLTFKAYHQYPFLRDNDIPKKIVTETNLAAPRAGDVALTLDQPLLIYSRKDLNGLFLDRAAKAGAAVEQTHVLGIDRAGAGWQVRTKSGIVKADYCVVATGARNPLREYGTEMTAASSMFALGYYVPGHREGIDIQFLPELEGYIWVFPRCGHLSVGICGKGEPAASLRKRLEIYMVQHDIPTKGATFFSHLLPCLSAPAWKSNRVAGDGWLAVGDAAGLVDPVTGEGLYYAIRSADLAVQSLLSGPGDTVAATYRRTLRRDFAGDLEFGSCLAQRIFHGSFLFGRIPARMVQFTRRSPKFKAVIQDLFAGTQPYMGLKKRLLGNLNGSLIEIAMSLGFSRMVR
jgi:flavin-dependent dehydrogenase